MKELQEVAMDMLKSKWSHLYTFGYPQKPFPTNYEKDLNMIMLGLTSKYVEKEKLRFTIDQFKILTEKIGGYSFKNVSERLEYLEQQLKQLEK